MFWSQLLQRLKRAQVRSLFDRHSQELHDKFLCELQAEAEGQAGVWKEVEWITEPVIFVRTDRVEPHYALVGVSTIRAETAAEGAKVSSQAGTAVFQFVGGAWTTHGKLLLNLTPSEVLEKLLHQFMQPW